MKFDISKKCFNCCFSGHRNIDERDFPKIIEKIKSYMEPLINELGVNVFICGGALGFDLVAAQAVLQMKKKYGNIYLWLALPCYEQTKKWSENDRRLYESVKSCADRIDYISKNYSLGCMHKRDRFMVDRSSYCICYLAQESGGTYYTVKRALEKKSRVFNCCDSYTGSIFADSDQLNLLV